MLPSKEQFKEALLARADDLYAVLETTHAEVETMFPNASRPLDTPEFVAEESGVTIAQMGAETAKLKADMAKERLAIALVGVLEQIGFAYVGAPKI